MNACLRWFEVLKGACHNTHGSLKRRTGFSYFVRLILMLFVAHSNTLSNNISLSLSVKMVHQASQKVYFLRSMLDWERTGKLTVLLKVIIQTLQTYV